MLNLFPMAYCPHYNEEGRKSFDEMLKTKNLAGLAMENDTAFVVNNEKSYFIRSNPYANAFKIQYKNGIIEKQALKFKK